MADVKMDFFFEGRRDGTDEDDWFYGSRDAEDFIGLAGSDTVDYSDSTMGVRVNLQTGLGRRGSAERDTYDGIENVVGSQYRDLLQGNKDANTLIGLGGDDYLFGYDGDDAIYGGDGADWLAGGAGADILDGGTGIDTVSYSASSSKVGIDLEKGLATGGDANGDTLVKIENIYGSRVDNNELFGDGGSNTIYSNGSNDVVDGRGGNDVLFVHQFDSQVSGGAGNDIIYINNGGHIVDGGSGEDELNLRDGNGSSWEVDLAQGFAIQGQYYDESTLTSIENVVGSFADDIIRGDNADNTLSGGAGHDLLEGRRGDDVLRGDGGSDTFVFDHHDYGERDVIVDFEALLDIIDLSDTEVSSWNDLNESADGDYWEQVGSDVVIHSSDTDIITLQNTQLANVNWFDFNF